MDGASLFESIPPDDKQSKHMANIKAKAAELYQAIKETKDSRERDEAIYHLETCVMWAVKGVSRNP